MECRVSPARACWLQQASISVAPDAARIASAATGAGADTYVVDDAGDSVTDTIAGAAGGIDHVNTSVPYSLAGTQIENATFLAAGSGLLERNELNNKLTRAANADTLSGGGWVTTPTR